MRILYVIQRYGEDVAGGAEQYCREIAERMAARGHDIDVLTTCASSYTDWQNTFPAGTVEINGVTVHRLPVARPREHWQFARLDQRMRGGQRPRPIELQREWMRIQGPFAPRVPEWLRERSRTYEVVVFVTYLYWTTWAGLRAVAGCLPTILQPAAHDEPPLQNSLFDSMFRLPDGFALFTPEEADLIERRFHIAPTGAVVGIGVEFDEVTPDTFRAEFGLGDAPYVLYVGRVDPAKGASELFDFFTTFKERNPSDLRLVYLGDPVVTMPEHPDVITTGFVSGDMRHRAMAGALALVQPSYFESFSMVLTETFAQSRPALVQGRCEVLRGHARRSGAALPYEGFAEFEVALQMLVEDPARADEMGRRGRAYVEREYDWEVVLDRYEDLVTRVVGEWSPAVSESDAAARL